MNVFDHPTGRLGLRVRGVVQGVGFRPHAHGLARRLALSGWVRNDGAGVEIEVQGAGAGLEAFVLALRNEAPPLAHIDAIERRELAEIDAEAGFAILDSRADAVSTAIGPDAATCPACLAEMCDPADRRYRYPFVNCTHCGPRFTITRALPYDRPQTAMAGFAMCPDCRREYDNPDDRRFHAQPLACPACGPRLSHSIEDILRALREGKIVALKGLGGFHLVCDARHEAAVTLLRDRKNREEKPLAVMVANLAALADLAECDDAEAALLSGVERPVVLLRKKPGIDAHLAPSVAPGLAWLGVMLPYTPLHTLLFHEAAGHPSALVMTSANPGGEPIVIGNDEAQERLADIADLIVTHDRDIVLRADDSVMRVVEGRPAFIRRARGYVPRAIRLAGPVRPVLALGAHLKNTLCVTRGDEAFVSQHIGDLDNVASIGFLEETIRHFLSILEVEPERVAHDWHPDFHSTILAQSLNLPLVPVQHHHAHLAAIAAEHRIEGELLGLALDGFGLGEEDRSWGGEMLLVDGPFYERLGHLAPLPQPGGDAAAREPWRMAAAVLHRLGRADTIPTRFRRHPKAQLLAAMLDRDFNCPTTTSCGRLFDAACGLLGFDLPVSFEGQAPMLLEGMARRPVVMAGGWRIKNGVLDMLPLLDRLTSCEPEEGANLFHGTLAAALAGWVGAQAHARNLRHVALAGGCMLNAVLSDLLVSHLRANGLEPLIARQVPPNDGGLSLGQAWVAALAPL